jgi:hypothetical protein
MASLIERESFVKRTLLIIVAALGLLYGLTVVAAQDTHTDDFAWSCTENSEGTGDCP